MCLTLLPDKAHAQAGGAMRLIQVLREFPVAALIGAYAEEHDKPHRRWAGEH